MKPRSVIKTAFLYTEAISASVAEVEERATSSESMYLAQTMVQYLSNGEGKEKRCLVSHTACSKDQLIPPFPHLRTHGSMYCES